MKMLKFLKINLSLIILSSTLAYTNIVGCVNLPRKKSKWNKKKEVKEKQKTKLTSLLIFQFMK